MIRRSLTAKVITFALIGLAVVLLLAGFGLSQLLTISASISRLSLALTSQAELSAKFHISLSRAVAEGQTLALLGDSESFDEAQELLDQAEDLLAQLSAASAANMAIDNPATINAYQQLQAERGSLVATVRRLVASIESGDAQAKQAGLAALEEIEARLSGLDLGASNLIELSKAATIDANNAATQRGLVSLGVGFGLIALMGLAGLFIVRRQIVAPLSQLSGAAMQLAAGELDHAVQVSSDDEIGVLQRAFNQMSEAIRAQTGQLEREIVAAHAAREEAEQARAQIADQFAQIDAQQHVIREMSVPVMPLTASTLVMPLVGALDTERLRMLQEQALRTIERTSARYLLLDVTGVSLIDTQVARGLIRVTQAARLLGAEAVLVGIRPEVAQSIVSLGVMLDDVITRSTLQSGVAYAMGRPAA